MIQGELELVWPWLLLLLPAPWLVARFAPPAPVRIGAALRLPFFGELPAALGGGGRDAQARMRRLLAWLAWGLLVLGCSRPQWIGAPLELPVTGRDLMLAVDVSGSMEQEDYEVNGRIANRLDMVKAVAGDFIERREGDRIGLVLFGARAYLQTPLTYDRATVATMLREAVIGLAGRETAIGDAIGIAVKRLREAVEADRVLILLTDGANTAGTLQPLEAARLAADAGVRIHTIGIGSGEVGIRTPFGLLRRASSDLDPETLRRIADLTGGRFFAAGDTNELDAIYAELDRIEPTARDSRSFRPLRALYFWPAGGALLIALALLVRLPERLALLRGAAPAREAGA